MKRLMLAMAIAGAGSATAQVKKPAAKPAPAKPAAPVFKNATDSFSYAAGLSIAESMKQGGVEKLNPQLCAQAMNDVFAGKKALLTPEQANMTLQSKLKEFADKKSAEQKQPGVTFLEVNKKRKSVIELSNGIQYEVLQAGDVSGIKPGPADTVVVNYAGSLIDGKEFDNSHGNPITFPLTNVIRGWTDILQHMTKGDRWKVYIPENLAYGATPPTQAIPPYSVLVFEISLLDIKPVKTANQ